MRVSSILAACAALSVACTGGTRDPAVGSETSRAPSTPVLAASGEFGPVRFAIQAERANTNPVYVQLNTESSQIGWVTVFRGTERVYLQERCELADCGQEPAVCGAAVPVVRNIGGSASQRSVEFNWDGKTSAQSSAGCEIRERVTSAEPLRARFCYSSRAQIEGSANENMAMGRLVEPVCVDKVLIARDTALVFVVPRG